MEINNTGICDLNVESDMPRVISQEDAESGLSGMTAIISILIFLLLGAGFAIVVLLRRDNSEESIFYDDEWEDEEYTDQKITPILPPMAPERPDLDAATKALVSSDNIDEDSVDLVEPSSELPEPEPEPVAADDPWADIDHSSVNESEPEPDIQADVEEAVTTEEIEEVDKSEDTSENETQSKKKNRRTVKRRGKSSKPKKTDEKS